METIIFYVSSLAVDPFWDCYIHENWILSWHLLAVEENQELEQRVTITIKILGEMWKWIQ